mmetsp:Transcript_47509/g.117655  ORF Transcript_47509/g.117655 Transcript_47509/m.117655 type:complete len:177 (+) Transcript_47509:1137-1667(+)
MKRQTMLELLHTKVNRRHLPQIYLTTMLWRMLPVTMTLISDHLWTEDNSSQRTLTTLTLMYLTVHGDRLAHVPRTRMAITMLTVVKVSTKLVRKRLWKTYGQTMMQFTVRINLICLWTANHIHTTVVHAHSNAVIARFRWVIATSLNSRELSSVQPLYVTRIATYRAHEVRALYDD